MDDKCDDGVSTETKRGCDKDWERDHERLTARQPTSEKSHSGIET